MAPLSEAEKQQINLRVVDARPGSAHPCHIDAYYKLRHTSYSYQLGPGQAGGGSFYPLPFLSPFPFLSFRY